MNYFIGRLGISGLFLTLIAITNCNCKKNFNEFTKLENLINVNKGQKINQVLIPNERIGTGYQSIIWKGINLIKLFLNKFNLI